MSKHQNKPSFIIVDDNEADRIMLRALLKQYPQFSLYKEYSKPLDVLAELETVKIDIAFLDIDMPELNGLELRKKLDTIDVCIFVTSHSEYALDGFELAAFDFIIKPISRERINRTLDRLVYYFDIKTKAHLLDYTLGSDVVFIKEGTSTFKVSSHSIMYLEAYKDYTKVITKDKSYCVLSNLGKLLQESAFQSFIRVHKSFAIQKHFIDKISSKEIMINEISIPIGRSYKSIIIDLNL